jgi:D-alanyl-D-alanine carboxypeptidase/D-alanyl-D-alanine-endopeptidase (penicillin-binding protein 4)
MRKLTTIFLLLALACPASAAPPNTQKLRKGIETVLALDEVARSKVGIYVADVRTGEELYSLNADELFNPASNTKLVTSATALDHFGPSFTWTTRLSYEGRLEAGMVDSIWLKSDGDPFLVYEDVMRFALAAKREGVREVKGDVMVDDTSFAPGYMPPGYDQKDEDASYRAPIGAVSVNFNAIAVTVKAGKDGVEVELYPPNDYIVVKNSAKLTKGKRQRISVRSVTDGDRTRIEVTGTLGTDAPALEVRKRIDHPGLYAASVLRQAMVDVGIKVNGTFKVGTRPDKTTTLMVESSEPLAWSISGMNKWSNNFIAEQLFRLLGATDDAPATNERAHAVIEATMKKLGVADGWKIMNGSGLYDGNLFSPRQLGTLLVAMAGHRFAPEFEASLSIAGADGTLAGRLKTKDLRGKTGTLNSVSALSGYATTASGRHVSYVILFNDTPVRAWTLRDEQDKMAQAITDWSE